VDLTDLQEEQRRMDRVRLVADVTLYLLATTHLSRVESLSVIEHARTEILRLCPGKEAVFDLVLRPRFLRAVNERALREWGLTDSIN
jgi:hypothetical protein